MVASAVTNHVLRGTPDAVNMFVNGALVLECKSRECATDLDVLPGQTALVTADVGPRGTVPYTSSAIVSATTTVVVVVTSSAATGLPAYSQRHGSIRACENRSLVRRASPFVGPGYDGDIMGRPNEREVLAGAALLPHGSPQLPTAPPGLVRMSPETRGENGTFPVPNNHTCMAGVVYETTPGALMRAVRCDYSSKCS